MKRANRLICLLAVLLGVFSAAPTLAQTALIHAGQIIVDADSEPRGPVTIVVANGQIEAISDGYREPGEGEALFDLSDKTVMPGLIDLHTHLSGDPGMDFRDWATRFTNEWFTVLAVKNSHITAKAGFTTVRDLGSRSAGIMNAVRKATADGLLPGPRILSAGKTIAIIGGNGDASRGYRPELEEALLSGSTCTGAVECAAVVRRVAKYGVDLIKLKITRGVLSSRQGLGSHSQFTSEELRSIVDTAHSLGLKVAAHAHGARAIEAAARAGVDTIEHGTYIDRAAARAMKDNDTVLVPTLAAMTAELSRLRGPASQVEEISEVVASYVSKARKWGVAIAFGTDSGVFAHGRNAEEFELMLAQGMSSREAVSSATTVAAKVLGLDDQIGRLAPGYSADIIALVGNPLDDATLLEQVDWVMVRGKVVE